MSEDRRSVLLLTASASSQAVKGPTDLVSNDGCTGKACYSAQDCCTPECQCDCVFKAGSSSKVGFCRKVNGRRRWISRDCFLFSPSVLVFPHCFVVLSSRDFCILINTINKASYIHRKNTTFFFDATMSTRRQNRVSNDHTRIDAAHRCLAENRSSCNAQR